MSAFRFACRMSRAALRLFFARCNCAVAGTTGFAVPVSVKADVADDEGAAAAMWTAASVGYSVSWDGRTMGEQDGSPTGRERVEGEVNKEAIMAWRRSRSSFQVRPMESWFIRLVIFL